MLILFWTRETAMAEWSRTNVCELSTLRRRAVPESESQGCFRTKCLSLFVWHDHRLDSRNLKTDSPPEDGRQQ